MNNTDNAFLKVSKKYFCFDFNSVEIFIIAMINEYQEQDKLCYITNEQFAEDLSCSIKTISRTLQRLEELNVISRTTSPIKDYRRRTLTLNAYDDWKLNT